ncbi:uncharacterized protein FIBRA_01727 [Fibroporia radiculosa]|uniref:Uncharacterized protein n=1 Tax=Fibroporia radiculosa TaxID=599839 RepID=J4GL58_9APHY|nr:uncharacterized protein FIBRA_01727 [Fibroporia radiculosa]CCL99705.1 predicted protein [Fibroporia radiculosa]
MSDRHSFLSTTGLIRASSNASTISPATHARPGSTRPGKQTHPRKPKSSAIVTRGGITPLGPAFLVGIAVVLSLLFISSIACAFVGSDADEPPFKGLLDGIAVNNPGIVLLGDNVDVDVDEPSVTIRWTVIGCGSAFVLAGSEGTHGSTACGLPSIPLNVYVDSGDAAAFTYDPGLFPIVNKTGQRIGIQNLCQFDSDHVLDVHEARLYPFDTYQLTSTLRIMSSDSQEPITMSALTTLKLTSSFVISPSDVASYMNTSTNVNEPGRDITIDITRPGEAKFFTLLLFAISWMLTHATMGFIVLAWVTTDEKRVLQYLFFVITVLLVIPQLRNAMPDAPGFDGVLLDSIGFFPQMMSSGMTSVVLLIIIAKRGLESMGRGTKIAEKEEKRAVRSATKGLDRLRRQGSSVDFQHLRSWSRTAFRLENSIAEVA